MSSSYKGGFNLSDGDWERDYTCSLDRDGSICGAGSLTETLRSYILWIYRSRPADYFQESIDYPTFGDFLY